MRSVNFARVAGANEGVGTRDRLLPRDRRVTSIPKQLPGVPIRS